MIENTIPRQVYIVTAKNDCEVSASKNGTSYILITLKAGEQGTFVAISDSVECTDAEAIILPFA